MRTIFRIVVVLQFIAMALCIGVAANVWMDAGAVIDDARQHGVLSRAPPRTPLSPFEHTVAVDQFAQTWGQRAFPCRTLELLWRDMSDADWTPPTTPASQRLATAILANRRGASIRWQVRRILVACQLEQDYDDAQLMRAWLTLASFGPQTHGVEDAAQAIFGKSADALNAEEAARLVALLHTPSLRTQPERWAERAREIQQRVAAEPR